MSSDALDTEVDLDAIVDRTFIGDVGIPHSTELLAFTNAIHGDEPDLDSARHDLLRAAGIDGVTEAAATVAVFNGLVRVADGTGIQLDQGLQAFSADDRARLGIDRYAGATNTDEIGSGRAEDVRTIGDMTIGDMFG